MEAGNVVLYFVAFYIGLLLIS